MGQYTRWKHKYQVTIELHPPAVLAEERVEMSKTPLATTNSHPPDTTQVDTYPPDETPVPKYTKPLKTQKYHMREQPATRTEHPVERRTMT